MVDRCTSIITLHLTMISMSLRVVFMRRERERERDGERERESKIVLGIAVPHLEECSKQSHGEEREIHHLLRTMQ